MWVKCEWNEATKKMPSKHDKTLGKKNWWTKCNDKLNGKTPSIPSAIWSAGKQWNKKSYPRQKWSGRRINKYFDAGHSLLKGIRSVIPYRGVLRKSPIFTILIENEFSKIVRFYSRNMKWCASLCKNAPFFHLVRATGTDGTFINSLALKKKVTIKLIKPNGHGQKSIRKHAMHNICFWAKYDRFSFFSNYYYYYEHDFVHGWWHTIIIKDHRSQYQEWL